MAYVIVAILTDTDRRPPIYIMRSVEFPSAFCFFSRNPVNNSLIWSEWNVLDLYKDYSNDSIADEFTLSEDQIEDYHLGNDVYVYEINVRHKRVLNLIVYMSNKVPFADFDANTYFQTICLCMDERV